MIDMQAEHGAKQKGMISTFKEIYTSPLSIFTSILGIALYYYLFSYINAASFFMLAASIYLVYALIVSSALLLTASVYSIKKLLSSAMMIAAGTPLSAVTASLGSMMACSCHYSLFASVLAFIGLSSAEIAGIASLDFLYGNYFVAAFIVANVGLLLYTVRRLRLYGNHK